MAVLLALGLNMILRACTVAGRGGGDARGCLLCDPRSEYEQGGRWRQSAKIITDGTKKNNN